jgi:hypothetical protein
MKKKEKVDLKNLETKIDLLFSVQANAFLAKQAMQVYTAASENEVPDVEGAEKIKEVAEKALESYKHHSQNVNDSIAYYYDLFGVEANENIAKMLKERGIYDEDGNISESSEVGMGGLQVETEIKGGSTKEKD